MNPCRQHSWISPSIGGLDDALICKRCGYRIPFEYIDLNRQREIINEYTDQFKQKGKSLQQEAVDAIVGFDMHLCLAMDSWRHRMKQDDCGKSIIEAIDLRNQKVLEKGRAYQEAFEARITANAGESKAGLLPEQPQVSRDEQTEKNSDLRVVYLVIAAGFVLILALALLAGLC